MVTSSSAALPPASASRPATESRLGERRPRGRDRITRSKLAGERAALSAQIPVITVLPTAPVGPGDHRPTPTGKIIVDLLRGRMPATLGGGMNVVAGRGRRRGARARARARSPRRALHRRRRQPHARRALAADRASGRDGAADVPAPVRDRRRRRARRRRSRPDHRRAARRSRSRGCGWGGSRCTRPARRRSTSSDTAASSVGRRDRARRALVSRQRLCRLRRPFRSSARWASRPGGCDGAPGHLRVVQVGIGGTAAVSDAGNRDQRRALRRPAPRPDPGNRGDRRRRSSTSRG